MNRIAQELDDKLRSLDPTRARDLETLVRDAFQQVDQETPPRSVSRWPPQYFEQTSGALKGEDFQRPPQGELPLRENW